MLAMIACVDSDDRGNDLRVIFQFNRLPQADPKHPMKVWGGGQNIIQLASKILHFDIFAIFGVEMSVFGGYN